MASLADRGIVALSIPLPLPMEINGHVRAFDQHSIDPEVQLYAIVNRKVPFNLEFKPTQTVERHEQGLEICRIFVDIGLAQALDGRIDTSDLRGIRRVHAIGFRAGECGQTQEADEGPEKESTNAFSRTEDHAPTIIARSGAHSAGGFSITPPTRAPFSQFNRITYNAAGGLCPVEKTPALRRLRARYSGAKPSPRLDNLVRDRLLSPRFTPAFENIVIATGGFMSSVVKKRKKKMRKHKHRKLRRRMKFARRKG
jgi:hypothetical protein